MSTEGPLQGRAKRFMPHSFTDDGPYVDRFGLLLVVTIAGIVGLSLFDIVGTGEDTTWNALGALAASWLVAATLLIALRASGLSRRRQRFVDVVVALGLLGVTLITFTAIFGDSAMLRGRGYNPVGAIALLSIIVPVVVVRRLLRHERVTSATLLGAIAAYLLIPIAYFHIFLAINGWSDVPFFGQPQSSTSFMYFSLVTLTTVGFGDLTAVTNLGRLAATSLAVVGQVYLVVFVAMIVGLRAQEWRKTGSGALLPPPDSFAEERQADEHAEEAAAQAAEETGESQR
jgi:drug/metabolite transporter (DMT)-like permease